MFQQSRRTIMYGYRSVNRKFMAIDWTEIRRLIREDRQRRDHSQAEYGRDLGLSQSQVSELERGIVRRLSFPVSEALKQRFGRVPIKEVGQPAATEPSADFPGDSADVLKDLAKRLTEALVLLRSAPAGRQAQEALPLGDQGSGGALAQTIRQMSARDLLGLLVAKLADVTEIPEGGRRQFLSRIGFVQAKLRELVDEALKAREDSTAQKEAAKVQAPQRRRLSRG
jgi:transcriptional regulator with XRE-family HTH domain